jgi:hypothetical protein
MNRQMRWRGWTIFVVLMAGLMMTACNLTTTDTAKAQELRTWLLVSPPDTPLPCNKPVNVRSRTQDVENFVSHVELYAVELPAAPGNAAEENVLVRADAAPFQQTTFTASQLFIPKRPGHYVIKVIGYNKLGDRAESDYIGFDVIDPDPSQNTCQ